MRSLSASRRIRRPAACRARLRPARIARFERRVARGHTLGEVMRGEGGEGEGGVDGTKTKCDLLQRWGHTYARYSE